MHATCEFDQLVITLLWAEDQDDAKIDPASRERLEAEYQAFCDSLPEDFDPEESCLTMG